MQDSSGHSEKGGRGGCRGAIAPLVVLLLLAIGGGWFLLEKAGDLWGRISGDSVEMMRGVKEVLGLEPKVTTATTVLHEGARGTLELALAEEEMIVEHVYENTWMGSRKELHLRAAFRVKAGYRLEDGHWHLEQRQDGTFALHLPPPGILSCEPLRWDVLKDEEGYWNKLSADERSGVHNAVLEKARAGAAGGSLPGLAGKELERRLDGAFARRSKAAPVVLQQPAPAAVLP